MEQVDVAIVGARVGGSVLATLLAQAGHRVLVVDAARFPSDTISTHFFRGEGLGAALVRLGLLDAVLALGCPPLRRQYDYAGMDPTPLIGPPQDPGELGYALSVRRLSLDVLLVERARAAGADVREATVVRALTWEGDRVTGLVTEGEGGRVETAARLVVGADGRSSLVARLVQAGEERREPASRAMYYRYVRGYRGPGDSWDGPEFSLIGDEMVYVFPSDDDVACVAVSVNLAVFQTFRSDPDAAFADRVASHPGIGPRFAGSMGLGRLLASGLKDAVVRAPWGPGWALVGDASMHQDPWSGLGMDNAGTHATYLAEAIDDWLAGRRSETDAFADYHRRRDAHALPGFDQTATLGRDLSQML
jgi:menaquinone-9 beta-reductase